MLPTTSIEGTPGPAAPSNAVPTLDVSEESKAKFEQLLWAELLTHTGLEDALTLGGGDGASMFARYFVEAIAEDIAKQHPLGLLDKELPSVDTLTLEEKATDNG
ncbi:MAG: hypothetical protein AAF642_10655 [Pseudomonadota bacterium]